MIQDIMLVSDNDIFREGLARILEVENFNIMLSADHLADSWDVEPGREFIVAIEFSDKLDHADRVATLLARYPSAIVVVLTDEFDMQALSDYIRAGARGYVTKTSKAAILVGALRLAALGEYVFPSDLAEVIDHNALQSHSQSEIEHDLEDANLSKREFDVLCCLMAGYSNKVIARELGLCEATIKVHVKAILRKLKVRNRTQAAIWAQSHYISDSCPSAAQKPA